MAPNLFSTVGSIADRLGVPVHRVRYIIDSRGIQPSGWAGHSRVFTPADVDHIKTELARIAKEGKS